MVKLLHFSSCSSLAHNISDLCSGSLCCLLVSANRFADGEVSIKLPTLHDVGASCDSEVVILHSMDSSCAIMELLFLLDALDRSGISKVVIIIPYFGYARQDRCSSGESLSAKVVANIICMSKIVSKIVLVDVHFKQFQGFFSVPAVNLSVSSLVADHFCRCNLDLNDCVVVAPDLGALERARALASELNVDLAVVNKLRYEPGVSKVIDLIGDISGKNCIIFDDIVDSGGTLCNTAAALKDIGACSIVAYVTHPILSGDAMSRIEESVIDSLYVTDSRNAVSGSSMFSSSKVGILSLSSVIAGYLCSAT